MSSSLCITVRFLLPYSHGRGEDGKPEWPPSPLRLMQALVAASAGRWNERNRLQHATLALRWLETLPPPRIISITGTKSDVPCQFFVPDNTADLLVPAWRKGEVGKQVKRTEKVVCPTLLEGEAVHYIYTLPTDSTAWHDTANILTVAARSISHLGWGIDMAVGDAAVLDEEQTTQLVGVRWHPSSASGTPLRVPKPGTLDDIARKHTDFLNRITDAGFRPVPPLRVFDVVRYRRDTDPLPSPFAIFRLIDDNGDTYRHSHSKLIHLAGMVRHLAIEEMKRNPPRVDDSAAWIDRYVAGHKPPVNDAAGLPHRQLSFVPLPSTGHPHTNPSVRRVMIVAPVGDDEMLEYVAARLDGLELKPERPGDLRGPVFLEHARRDNMSRYYTEPSVQWASFTPVILPGHDDHKPEKTRKLILKALAQSGIEQPCEFEWSAFSQFPKSYSAHKYVRDENAPDGKRWIGYFRPDHLKNLTAVHVRLTFDHEVSGPLVIGAGRHCGFGLMASIDR